MKREWLRWFLNPKGAAITLVGAVAVIGILSEPVSEEHWWQVVVVSKIIGFSAAYLDYRLIKRWFPSMVE